MDNVEEDKEELDQKTPSNTDQEETKYQSVPDIDGDKVFQKKSDDRPIVHFILIKCKRSQRNKGCKIKSVTINGKDKQALKTGEYTDLFRFSSTSNPWENQSSRTSFFHNIKKKAAFENVQLSKLPEPFNMNDKNPLLLSNENSTFQSFQINLSWYDDENDKESRKSDNINIKYNDIIWNRVSFKKREGIEARFKCQYNQYITIYSEYIRIKSTPDRHITCWNGHEIWWENGLKEIFNAYLNEYERPKGEDDDKWRSALNSNRGGFDVLRNFSDFQFYYIEDLHELPLLIETDVIKGSEVFFGLGVRASKFMSYHGTDPFDIQNITQPLWLTERYRWIKDKCLYGQDDEFNIFRSLCFISIDAKKVCSEQWHRVDYLLRLPIAILCVILQTMLTIGIVMEVIDSWDAEQMFENDIMIITISFIVFSFISYTYIFTVRKFYQFYKNMSYVAQISWYIIALDFLSNIIIGFVICLVSFTYLLQSDNIGGVVLNSFALTFIIQLDDLANLFEADESVLMKNDWDQYIDFEHFGDYDPVIKKRVIKIPFNTVLLCLISVLFSPLFIVLAAIWICYDGHQYYKIRTKHNAHDVLARTKSKNTYGEGPWIEL